MCSFSRHSTLAILFIFAFLQTRAQNDRCDSIHWNFDVNQFAIDGDNLLADFAEKGWTEEFFQTNEIDVTIYGATDCPGTYEYNSKLAGYRALYLRNYFEVSAFPKLTIANSYAIPERNCVKPGQGYNRADRVTALKVCWVGDLPAVSASTANGNKAADVKVNAGVNTKQEPLSTQQQKANEGTSVEEYIQPKEEKTEVVVSEEVKIEIAPADSAQTIDLIAEEQIDSLAQAITEIEKTDSLAITAAENAIESTIENAFDNSAVDSINIALLDSTVVLPSKPKKVFDIASTPDINKGDELIMEGLNFYPGSHRTLPEAKPILRKLLQLLQDNPTLIIEIQGHVCCASKPNEDGLDDETGDFKLSWNRAQYVRDYLIQNGVAESRITYRGFAMTRPLVYPEKTIQDQIKNRRVEILIVAE
jgi:outer membrane protein OmpA-like peptidoglycan-associated protein